MKYATLVLITFLAVMTTANAAGYSPQPYNQNPLNPHSLKPDLTPSLKTLPSAPIPQPRHT